LTLGVAPQRLLQSLIHVPPLSPAHCTLRHVQGQRLPRQRSNPRLSWSGCGPWSLPGPSSCQAGLSFWAVPFPGH